MTLSHAESARHIAQTPAIFSTQRSQVIGILRDQDLSIDVRKFGRRFTASGTRSLARIELASRTVYRRAVDAVIWGLPLVGEDTVKQAACARTPTALPMVPGLRTREGNFRQELEIAGY